MGNRSSLARRRFYTYGPGRPLPDYANETIQRISDNHTNYIVSGGNTWTHPQAPLTLSEEREESNWSCRVLGGEQGILFHPGKGQEPNWFHRTMHRLILGFVWVEKKR